MLLVCAIGTALYCTSLYFVTIATTSMRDYSPYYYTRIRNVESTILLLYTLYLYYYFYIILKHSPPDMLYEPGHVAVAGHGVGAGHTA